MRATAEDERAGDVTPERAEEVRALVHAEGGVAGSGCRRVERASGARWITNGVTVEEDDEIRARWASMPGWTTYGDAIADLARATCNTCGGDGRIDAADENGRVLRPECPGCMPER